MFVINTIIGRPFKSRRQAAIRRRLKSVSSPPTFCRILKLFKKKICNKRPGGLYSSAEILQKFANKIIWGGLIYKRESERINTPHC